MELLDEFGNVVERWRIRGFEFGNGGEGLMGVCKGIDGVEGLK